MLHRHLLRGRFHQQLPGVVSIQHAQQRFKGGYTPADMPIVKKKWLAAEKVGKICESMKNVAAGALPGCERHLVHARPFAAVTKPLFEVESTPKDVRKILHVPIGTERGMCGAVSSNTLKAITPIMKRETDKEHTVIVYGKRSSGVANTLFGSQVAFCATDVKTRVPTYEFCCQLAEVLLYEFEWDKAIIYFNEYENAVKFHLRQVEIYRSDLAHIIAELQFPSYEIEGDESTLVDNLVEYKLASTLYLCLAENLASEQASRLQSMDGATKNCQEMTAEYEKLYQGLRKTKITNELIILGVAVKLAQRKGQ